MKLLARLTLVFGLAFLQPAGAEDADKSVALKVIDLRPQEERDGVGLTELSGKCNKDVYRIADVASDPLKVEALRADLAQQMGLASDEKTLMVLNWSIYYNKQTKHSGPKLSDIGIQGYGIPGKKKETELGSKCLREESAGGCSSSRSPLSHPITPCANGRTRTAAADRTPGRCPSRVTMSSTARWRAASVGYRCWSS